MLVQLTISISIRKLLLSLQDFALHGISKSVFISYALLLVEIHLLKRLTQKKREINK